MSVQECTAFDIPWLVETAGKSYAEWMDEWDEEGAIRWVAQCIADPDMLCVKADHTVGFAQIISMPWAPTKLVCDLLHLWSDGDPERSPHEAMEVVGELDLMRRARGCSRFYIGSIYRDLSPIAKRLGGRALNTTWVVE
jgi:hypothetical protein